MPESSATHDHQAPPPGRRRTRRHDDEDILVPVEAIPPRIPEGEYTARSAAVERRRVFGRLKLQLTLVIFGGPSHGIELVWYCSVPENGRRPKGFSSKFARAWVLAAGRRPLRG